MSGNKAVSKTTDSTGGLAIKLHPLALLNISDHHTRCRLSSSSTSKSRYHSTAELTAVIGVLLGTQASREVSIVNSFEIRVHQEVNGTADVVDIELLQSRKEQFLQVFPTLDIIGWYSNGDDPDQTHIRIHKQMASIVDNPVFLLYTSMCESSQDLPVRIFEANSSNLEDPSAANQNFVALDYGIETGEAERIAVDGVARGDMGEGGSTGAVAGSLTTQRNAIRMLFERAQVLQGYLEKSGQHDHSILRQISSLTSSLPAIDTPVFEKEISADAEAVKGSEDVQVTSYLAALTQQLDALSEYGDKHSRLWPAKSDEYADFPMRPGRHLGRKR